MANPSVHSKESRALEFLPALLEIRDTPPHRAGRWLLHGMAVLVVLTLAWACAGRVDVIAVAPGQVIPAGRSKPLQAPDVGTVREILVRDGQRVRAGQPLLRLDTAELDAERGRLAGEQHAEALALAGSLALVALPVEAEAHATDAVAGLDAALVAANVVATSQERELQLGILRSRHAEYLRRLEALSRRDAAREAERRAAASTANELESSLGILGERALAAQSLAERGMLARDQQQERELARLQAHQQLSAARERIESLLEDRAGISAERAALVEAERHAALAAVELHTRNKRSLDAELARIGERIARAELRAPADGVVQQLAVRSAGAVVQPAEALLLVVPGDAPLEVEAWVLDRDIGFVHKGQDASVKIDAFDFSRYGLVPAEVRALSPQAVQHDRLGTVYEARIALARGFFELDGRRVALAPGMAVKVEVRTGTRRIIEYFLSPIALAARDSIRER